ncbi:MAG: lasso peptide biosynthesis B2 protein [Candidatus Binatia bacterium]
MKQLRKFLLLPPIKRGLLLRSVILLCAIRIGLWLVPFQTLRRFLDRGARVPANPRRSESSPQDRIAWAVRAASRFAPGGSNCLTEALAAQVLLNRQGFRASLHIGVARDERGKLDAHAWVESQGRVVIGGSELERYTSLSALE